MARILLAGATGLIGGAVAQLLAQTEHELHIISRRAVEGLPARVHQHIAPTGDWPVIIAGVKADIAVSCLGTTMKLAGSKAAFAAVDHDLVLAFASIARAAGAWQFIGVSSVGADAKASNFYLSIKGKAEQSVAGLGFDRVDFLRPGLLRGERGGDRRTGERLGIILSPLMDLMLAGPLRKYRSISAQSVARAIIALLDDVATGQVIHENDAIMTLAG